VDVLSDMLQAIRLTGSVYFDVSARAPWIAETPPVSRICANVMPGFEHVISFHIMLEGLCWVQLADESEPPVRLETGDAVIFVQGDGNYMCSQLGQRSVPDLGRYHRPRNTALPFVLNQLGGDGEPARFVCGYLGCDSQPLNPFLASLPRLLHIRFKSEAGVVIHNLIGLTLEEEETPRAGSETILSRLSELMFLQAVRQYIGDLPAHATGWFAGLRDRQIGAALTLIHGQPARPWTLDALAHEVGMSRSSFVDRFTGLLGTPPMHYLSHWRLQLSTQLLERPKSNVGHVAAEVGYESEAAFSRAFKKAFGLSPGTWRHARAARTSTNSAATEV
jgi:AraC-like DNA-binding protein